MILVVCAVAEELPGIQSDANIDLLTCGIGPVEAAAATARALALGRYEAVISAGIAGAFPGCGNVGDAYIVGEDTYAEIGWEDGKIPNLPDGAQLIEQVNASSILLERTRALPYRVVRGVTVTQVTGTRLTAEKLRLKYDAEIETMESFAVLRAAQKAGVPAIGIRGISNIVGARAESAWNFQAGCTTAVRAFISLVKTLSVVA